MDTPAPITPEIEPSSLIVPSQPPTIRRNASWGAILSIFIILVMVVVGAFYAWGQRISEENAAQTTQP